MVKLQFVKRFGYTCQRREINFMEENSYTGLILSIIIGIVILAVCGLLTGLFVFLAYLII